MSTICKLENRRDLCVLHGHDMARKPDATECEDCGMSALRRQIAKLERKNATLKAAARALLDALPRCESDRLETFGARLPVHTSPVPATREAFDYRRSAYVCEACAQEIERMDHDFKPDAGLRLPWADAAEALRKAVEG